MLVQKNDVDRRPFWLLALLFIVICTIVYFVVHSLRLDASKDVPELSSKAAILIDAETGDVLYEKNANNTLPPASMSKLMTQLIVLDQLESGLLAWNERVAVSHYSAQVPGSQLGIKEGEHYTVRELFDAMVIQSANDAAIALAEHISGSEAAFVEQMNERARKLGLSVETIFANATGLNKNDLIVFPAAAYERDTMMTAKDVAQLAGYLIKRYPVILDSTSRSSIKLSSNAQVLKSTNEMLEGRPYAYPGNDGLKTGYTPEAGYCFVGTAKQDGRRLISVIMGADSSERRFIETKKLLQFGFEKKGLGELLAQISRSS